MSRETHSPSSRSFAREVSSMYIAADLIDLLTFEILFPT